MHLLSTISLPIRWVDMDAYQHVSNAKYFDYMSETRATWFAQQQLLGGLQFVVVETSCQFIKALDYPKTIIIAQYLTDLRSASFTLRYIFKDSSDSELIYAQGEATLVCLDPTTKRPVRVPDKLQALMREISAEDHSAT